jgi:hypothetical protein
MGSPPTAGEEALRLLKELLTDYEKHQLGSSTTESDEDELSKFDDR